MDRKKKPLKNLRGFPDILPERSFQRDSLLAVCEKRLKSFDFERVDPPIVERAALFERTLGQSSDIVGKEMYSFQKEGESLTLRPEGTACLARMFVAYGMERRLPLRWYYKGPMFRHERPQKGRFRQFFQLGAEFLGDNSRHAELEILSLAYLLIKDLGLEDKSFLEINSLGSLEERAVYKEKFKSFLQPLKSRLSPQSQIRFETNPLRIWDSKDSEDKEILKKAPFLRDSLKGESRDSFQKSKKLLRSFGIPFEENPRLVRGLDYYNGLVFEFKSRELGAQSAFLAGGRYDHLTELLGGPFVPAVGWALGLERLSLLCPPFEKDRKAVGLIAVGDRAEDLSRRLAFDLRALGLTARFRFSGNFSRQMKRIAPQCRFALIMGERETERSLVLLKDLETGGQSHVPLSRIKEELQKISAAW